jgi:hypothetical protein
MLDLFMDETRTFYVPSDAFTAIMECTLHQARSMIRLHSSHQAWMSGPNDTQMDRAQATASDSSDNLLQTRQGTACANHCEGEGEEGCAEDTRITMIWPLLFAWVSSSLPSFGRFAELIRFSRVTQMTPARRATSSMLSPTVIPGSIIQNVTKLQPCRAGRLCVKQS